MLIILCHIIYAEFDNDSSFIVYLVREEIELTRNQKTVCKMNSCCLTGLEFFNSSLLVIFVELYNQYYFSVSILVLVRTPYL